MNIVLLCGGVGGSKLALGLYTEFPDATLSIIVNTGDDLEVLGLHVSPDLDTVMYTLAGLSNPVTGWGLADDTFQTLGMLSSYGHESWFQLGDRDLATHLMRTSLLRSGLSLTQVTQQLAGELKVRATIIPMCNEPVSTRVLTSQGWLAFQEYFVKRGHADTPLGVVHAGAEAAVLTPESRQALLEADCIVVAPSNPVVSIGPILAISGTLDILRTARERSVAVSPIVGGRAVSGPAGELMQAQGFEPASAGVARMYASFSKALVIDSSDLGQVDEISQCGVLPVMTNTIMTELDDKRRVARIAIEAAGK